MVGARWIAGSLWAFAGPSQSRHCLAPLTSNRGVLRYASCVTVPTDTDQAVSSAGAGDDQAAPFGTDGGVRRVPLVVAVAVTCYVAVVAVVAGGLDTETLAGRVLWAALPIPMSVSFALSSALLARRSLGSRRRFWTILAVGIATLVLGQVWRLAALALSLPADVFEALYAGLSTVGISIFMSALVIRLRILAPATWGVQFLDAAAVGVVISTFAVLPLATGLGGAPLDAYLIALQPLVLMILASGAASALFTPMSWRDKATDGVLSLALCVGFAQAVVEMYATIRYGDRFPVLSLVLLSASFAIATVAAALENPAARPPVVDRQDYDSAAWPYLLLGVLPVLALWEVVRGVRAQQVVAVAGLLAGFAIVVLRQLQILRTQRLMLADEARITDEMRQDTAIGRALLDTACKLASAPDRGQAERAVADALRTATGAPVVTTIDEAALSADPTAAVLRTAGASWIDGVLRRPGGLTASVFATDGRRLALLCADGPAWHPTAAESDLIAGLARQLGGALERGDLLGRIAAAEARYREVIDNLPVGVVELDADALVVRTNRAFDDLCGLAATDTVGHGVLEAFASVESDPPSAVRTFVELGEVRCSARVVTQAGLTKVVEIDAARLDARTSEVDAVVVVRDVTTEERLRRRIRHAASEIDGAAPMHAQPLVVLGARALLLIDEAVVAVRKLQFGHTDETWAEVHAAASRSLDAAIAQLRWVGDQLEAGT